MPSLHELQRAFGAALLFDDGAQIEPHVLANGIAPAARLRIYRNNTRENFLAALRASYPVLERLVGEDYFRQLAFEYRERHPSPSGNLHHVGEALPGYLEHRFATGEYSYFPDVARLEWAYQEVMVAADHAPLDIERLQHVAPARYPDLIFRLHPAARLVSSPYPVLTIWSANQADADPELIVSLDSGAEHVLVQRTGADGVVELRRLDAGEFAFLEHLARGASFAEAVAAAEAEAVAAASEATEAASARRSFDAGASLRRFVAARTLVDFHLPPAVPRDEPDSGVPT